MAAALKKPDGCATPDLARKADLPATAMAAKNPAVESPARTLQASLAKRLEQDTPSKSEAIIGLFAGIFGASWVTGLLIYATL